MSRFGARMTAWRAAGVYSDRRVLSLFFFGFASGLPLALTGATLAAWLTQAGTALGTIGFAALVVVMFGAGNGVGKIVMGMTSDRLGGRHAYQIAILAGSLGMLGMAFSETSTAMLGATAVFGFGLGGVTPQLTTIGVALFGVRSVGALMGAILALIGMAGASGALVSGIIFDVGGSYTPAFLAGAGVLALSMVLAGGLRR